MQKDSENPQEARKRIYAAMEQLVELTNTTYTPDRQQTQATLLMVSAIMYLSEIIRLK